MSLRLSISEAEQKNLISKSQAEEMRRRAKPKRVTGTRAAKAPSPKSKKASVQQIFLPIEGNTPQQKLWRAVVGRYPELVKSGDLVWELGNVVPGRKYSLDMAFKDIKLGIETDGWQFHGRDIKNFKRDRRKDRLLLLSGWRVLRFFASEINDELESVLDDIEQARQVVSGQIRTGGAGQ